MEKYPLIRKIYLYLFSMVGLILIIIAGVRFVDMALKAFIFTKADEELRLQYAQPPFGPFPVEKAERISQESAGKELQVTLTEDEARQIDQWLADYKNFVETRKKIDPVITNRQRDASINFALIIVGLPLYLYHWSVINQEMRRKEENDSA